MGSNSNQGRGQDGKKVDKNMPAHGETENGKHTPADPHKSAGGKNKRSSSK